MHVITYWIFSSVVNSIIIINFSHYIIFFYKATGPVLTKFDTKHHLVKGIQVCWINGQHLFQGEAIVKKYKYINFVPSLVEIGPVVLKKKMKMW